MSTRDTHPIRNSVIASVLTAGILYGLSWIPHLYAWCWARICELWRFLGTTADVPVWLIIFLVAGLIPTVRKFVGFVLRTRKPSFRDYREGNFIGAKWRWDYCGNEPVNLWCYCPRCDTRLVYSPEYHLYSASRTHFNCEACNSEVFCETGDKDYAIAKVSRLIERNIRIGEWQNFVKPRP